MSTTSIRKDPRPKEENNNEVITPIFPPESTERQNQRCWSQSTISPTKTQPSPLASTRWPLRERQTCSPNPVARSLKPEENLLRTAATTGRSDGHRWHIWSSDLTVGSSISRVIRAVEEAEEPLLSAAITIAEKGRKRRPTKTHQKPQNKGKDLWLLGVCAPYIGENSNSKNSKKY